jgi:hypothetical protein
METLRSQNEGLIVIDLRDEKLIEVLRQAITKGQEVCVVNFSSDYNQDVKVSSDEFLSQFLFTLLPIC